MKKMLADLAVFGGPRAFERVLPVGQINVPEQGEFESLFDGIFERRYYTNYGPLERRMEEELRARLNVGHVVMMTNATIGLTIAAMALGLPRGGRVIVPAFTFAATVQALSWAGLEPVFCDIDRARHVITAESVRPHIKKKGVGAILGVHLWGNACDIEGLEALADEYGVKVFYDAAHAVGCMHKGRAIGNFGACEVFSMHGTKALSSGEGGFVATNDSDLVEIIRNIRSSYGRRGTVAVDMSGNGRFSEAQAAMGLLGLKELSANVAGNKRRYELYRERTAKLPGVALVPLADNGGHNYQYIVFEIDEKAFGLSRDMLVQILHAENIMARRYFIPGMHRSVPYKEDFPEYVDALPVTDELCRMVLQLPSGQCVSDDDIERITDLLFFFHSNADEIQKKMS